MLRLEGKSQFKEGGMSGTLPCGPTRRLSGASTKGTKHRIFRIQLILSSPSYCSSSPTPSSFVPAPCSSSSPIPPACYSPELHLLPYLLPDIVLVHSVLVHSVTVFHRWLLTWKSDAKGVFVVCVRVLCVYVSYFGQQPKQTGDLDPTRSRRIQSLYELRCQIKLRLSYRKDYI